jgi:hypothetical protein
MSERLTMRKVREVLRLKYACGLPQREIAASCAISDGRVSEYLTRAREAGPTWEIASALSDVEVEARLFQQVGRNEPSMRAPIDFEWVHRELRRGGVTLQVLWVEYQRVGGSGFIAGRSMLSKAERRCWSACSACCAERPGRKPYEQSRKSCS